MSTWRSRIDSEEDDGDSGTGLPTRNKNQVSRRNVLGAILGAGALAGSGDVIGGWLASDGEERDFSSQQEFDSARDFLNEARGYREELDRETGQEIDELMSDIPRALNGDLGIGEPFGGDNGDKYIIAEAEEDVILDEGSTPQTVDQYWGITEEGVEVELGDEEINLNIFARGGSTVDDSELTDYQNVLENSAAVYDEAVRELTEGKEQLEDRVEEKNLPDQENHQNQLEEELENYENLESHYKSEAETVRTTAGAIEKILNAERVIEDGQRVSQYETIEDEVNDTDPTEPTDEWIGYDELDSCEQDRADGFYGEDAEGFEYQLTEEGTINYRDPSAPEEVSGDFDECVL